MRPTIFSCIGRRKGSNTVSVNDFVVDVWNVATIGPSAMFSASIDRLGAFGSCRCSTSKSPSASHLLTMRWVAGPNRSRATDPLYGIGTALPPDTT